VLLGPQRHERLRYPNPEGGKAVQARVAGGADCHQPLALVDARLAVMDVQSIAGPACPASVAIALQNVLAEAAEALAGACRRAVAGAAEAGRPRKIPAARAEQTPLQTIDGNSGHDVSVQPPSIRSHAPARRDRESEFRKSRRSGGYAQTLGHNSCLINRFLETVYYSPSDDTP